MRTVQTRSAMGPAVAVVGVWDPFMPEHQDLLAALAASARARGLASVAFAFDPDPMALWRGVDRWPTYNDRDVRARLIRGAGVDHVVAVRMCRPDVESTAEAFFATVSRSVTLVEIWLGARQSLGPGVAGSEHAIAEATSRRGIDVVRLPPTAVQRSANTVRGHLLAGDIEEAIAIVGRPPIRRRPRRERLRLVWRTGRYRAVPLATPDAEPAAPPLTVRLEPVASGPPALAWPDRAARYLAFVGYEPS